MSLLKKKSSILFIFTSFLLLLISYGGFYSIYITKSISNDATIINKLGIVRGSLQRVAKLELSGLPSEDIINEVDLIISEFRTEKIRMYDNNNEILDEMNSVEEAWNKLINTVYEYRKSSSEEYRLQLLQDSEDAWYKANNMVLVSQISSEQKISKYKLSFLVFFFNILLSIIIIFLIKKYVKDALEEMVNKDGLTGIYNRRFFSEILYNEIKRSERTDKLFSIIILDIDFFKIINDNYGHDIGDKILMELSEIVNQCIRKSDLFARIGGEEFALIAPEANIEAAVQLAEKIRRKVEEGIFANDLKITISLGISQYQRLDDVNTIFKRADNALYKAKGNGRNRVEYLIENKVVTIDGDV
ncbi:MAG: hypothetical protein A2Y23_06325 [Clostridiales bacterium GWB2_37_7]|nr:MAG: hypothetical protein A2Y23_06325 [Clostridiales bacterium GWB2_37_7]